MLLCELSLEEDSGRVVEEEIEYSNDEDEARRDR